AGVGEPAVSAPTNAGRALNVGPDGQDRRLDGETKAKESASEFLLIAGEEIAAEIGAEANGAQVDEVVIDACATAVVPARGLEGIGRAGREAGCVEFAVDADLGDGGCGGDDDTKQESQRAEFHRVPV